MHFYSSKIIILREINFYNKLFTIIYSFDCTSGTESVRPLRVAVASEFTASYARL